MESITVFSENPLEKLFKKPKVQKEISDEEYDELLMTSSSEVSYNYSTIYATIQDIKSKEEKFTQLREKVMAGHNKI